jgi:hypothetical protein
MKKFMLLVLVLIALFVTGCSSPADVASTNLSTAADNFKVERRIVFINGITDKYLMSIEGKCSLGNNDSAGELSVTCKTGVDENGEGTYKKHFLGLSDNVFYIVEQIDGVPVNVYNYKIIFRPETIVPDIEMKTSNQK